MLKQWMLCDSFSFTIFSSCCGFANFNILEHIYLFNLEGESTAVWSA